MMIYNNLLYFLVVIFIVSTNTPASKPGLPPILALAAFSGALWAYAQAARRMFARTAAGPTGYFNTEKKLSLLAVLVFVGFVYPLDLKYYLMPLAVAGHLPVLADIGGLLCFFLLLALLWRAARPHYQRIFQRRYTTQGFIWTNIKVNLPIVLPWLILSLVFDLLQLLPFPELAKLLRSPWGDVALFGLFLFFLMLIFPPLVLFLWGCTRIEPGPVRDRLQGFCRSQGLKAEIYYWPLFEGQVLTAGIMGIVPGLRYLMITPALLETLSEDELDSVLAHEIGHVKHLHLLLYAALFLGFSLLAGEVARPLPHLVLGSEFFYRLLAHLPITAGNLVGIMVTAPLLVLLVVYFRFVFGYFIRNFERQADAYVFRALGTSRPLIRSFEKIAYHSGGSRKEKNWHHFGIGERIDFLEQCERDRSRIRQHRLRLHASLGLYFVVIGLLVLGLKAVDTAKLAEGYETRYTEAVLQQKVRQEPENSLWLMYLGDFLHSRKMEQKAIEAYERALALTPTNAEAGNNLAWLLLTAREPGLRNPERALTLARTAVLVKERGYILDTLATAYWANGLVEEAVATEMRAIRLDPENRAYYQAQLERFRGGPWKASESAPAEQEQEAGRATK